MNVTAARSNGESARNRIIGAALQIGVDVGIESISVREIARSAVVSLSAINYHFGSMNGLIVALVKACIEEIDAIRAPILADLEQAAELTLRKILYAIVYPATKMLFGTPDQQLKSRFFGRALSTPKPEVQEIFDNGLGELQRIARLIEKLDLGFPLNEIYWRIHFTMALDHMNFFDLHRLEKMSAGTCIASGHDEVIGRMLDYAVAGFMASPAP
jgi:AcrR family transcriptional regulator